MTEQEKFHTRTAANEGTKLSLVAADGSATDEFLTIRGTDSDAFKFAQHKFRKQLMELLEETDELKVYETTNHANTVLLAALVIDWSFPEDCTEKNVINFLTNAPQIADQIDTLSTQRSLFTKGNSKSSVKQRKKGSPSTKKRVTKRSVKYSIKSGKRQAKSQKD